MDSFGIGERFGTFAIAAAIFFVAYIAFKSSRRGVKQFGMICSFIAGLAFLVTFVGAWITEQDWLAGLAVAGLIAVAGTIGIDWVANKKIEKPTFFALFALPFFLVLGVANIDAAGDQIGKGGKQVQQELQKVDDGGNKAEGK